MIEQAIEIIDDPFNTTSWQAIKQSFEKTWWSRVWTVQEIALARKVGLICGRKHIALENLVLATLTWHTLPFDDLYGKLKRIEGHDVAIDKSRAVIDACNAMAFIVKVDLYTDGHQAQPTDKLAPYELARRCVKLKVTDPRDRIYGPIGMAEHDPGFQANYSMPLAKVYCTFAKRVIFDGTVDIIRHAAFGGTDQDPAIPTWVPDWRLDSLPVLAVKPSRASLHEPASFKFLEGCGKLYISGMTCGVVGKSISNALLDAVVALAYKAHGVKGSHHIGLPKALLKTFAADEDYLDNAEEGLDEEALIDLHLLALRRTIDFTLRRTTLRLPHAGISEAEIAEHKEQNEDIWGLPSIHLGDSLYACNRIPPEPGRHFFEAAPDYLGLGPRLMQEGDLVCVIPGLQVPMILRPVDDHHLVIGECFTIGQMHGQAVHMMRSGKIEPRMFEFRYCSDSVERITS
ncbi:hypothetical protein LTS18_005972 [Coniosporium uncinatum]|uniref:Uncharacterized protein n=1 Tax=Coniosporium uncinatum TaxID=93489 RepID=A0ACC3DQP2_9PEZI|nr:hypothetical protein LTS18_005972 [Coniosporium uncinatum]